MKILKKRRSHQRIDAAIKREATLLHPLRNDFERYLSTLKEERRLRPKSLKHYQLELEILLQLLRNPTEIFPIKDHLKRTASTTYSRKLVIWRSFLKTCPEPWTHSLDSIALPKIRRKDPIFLTDEEVFLLEQACYKSPQMTRDRLLVAFALQLGLRISEILALKFQDIEGDWLRIIRKGDKEQRLPLAPSLQSLLRQWSEELGAGSNDWIFPGTARLGLSEPLTARAAQILLHRLAKLAGIQKKFGPHALRHTFATKLASTGVNLVALKEILGHEKITTTERYLHVTPTHLQEALGIKKTLTSRERLAKDS